MSWSKHNRNTFTNNDAYVHFTKSVSLYPDGDLASLTLGLTGEAGEVADKIKKYFRDGELNKGDVAKELGDTLWYLTRLADELGYSLSDVRNMNQQKLQGRMAKDTIRGNGDSR